MNNLPKVAVSIPTYNQESYIKEAIESVLAQTYENIHINVCDDCSLDNTWQVCQVFRNHPRVSIFRNDYNIGRVKNYQKQLYELSGNADWFLNLDGDDYLANPYYIENAIYTIINSSKSDDIVLYHAQIDTFPFRKNYDQKISKECFLVDGKQYVLNRPLIKEWYHLGALIKRNAVDPRVFYKFNSLHTDSLSVQSLALQGYVIVDGSSVGVWRKTGINESSKFQMPEEVEKYNIANTQFFNYLSGHFTSDEILIYKANYETAAKYERIIRSVGFKKLLFALKAMSLDKNLRHCFWRDIAANLISYKK